VSSDLPGMMSLGDAWRWGGGGERLGTRPIRCPSQASQAVSAAAPAASAERLLRPASCVSAVAWGIKAASGAFPRTAAQLGRAAAQGRMTHACGPCALIGVGA
jgi:hypothetical protein